MKVVVRRLALVVAVLLVAPRPAAAREPVFLIVRGVGADTPARQGWTPAVPRLWGVGEVRQVVFPYEGGRVPETFPAAAPHLTGWARVIQPQIAREVERARREDRPVVLVSQGWGSVATAIALEGGGDRGYPLRPAPLPAGSIDRWVTLASPIGLARNAIYRAEGIPVHLQLPAGRPAAVAEWTNIVNPADPVQTLSRRLEGAENVEVRGSAAFWDLSGENLERGIWIHPDVVRAIRRVRQEVIDTAAARAAAAAAETAPVGETVLVETTTRRGVASETAPRRGAARDPEGCLADGVACGDFRTNCPCREPGNCAEALCTDPRGLRRPAAGAPPARTAAPAAAAPAAAVAGCATAADESQCARHAARCPCRRFGVCGMESCRPS